MIGADFEKYLKMTIWTGFEGVAMLLDIEPDKFTKELIKYIDDSTEPFKYSYDDPFRFDSNTMTKETIRVHNEEMIEKIRLSKSNSTVIKKLLPKMIAIIDVMNRDLDFGFIKPYAEKDDIYYFKSCDFIDWAISKSFDVPVELKEFAKSKTTTAPPVQQDNAPKEKTSKYPERNNDFMAWRESETPPLDKMTKTQIHTRLIERNSQLWASGFKDWWEQQDIYKASRGRKKKRQNLRVSKIKMNSK